MEKLTDKIIDLDDVRKGGQASADQDAGADPITDQGEIRKRVQEKIDEAKARDPDGGKKESLDDIGNGKDNASTIYLSCA